MVNVCVLPLQIYRPDSHTFSDKNVLFKFISKEVFKQFFFSLGTNLVCKIYNLLSKIFKHYMINLRYIDMYFICQKVISYKIFSNY